MLTLTLAFLLAHGRPSPPVVHGPRSTTNPRPVYRFVSREPGVGNNSLSSMQETSFSRIDPATNTVVSTLPAHRGLQGLAFDGTDLWAAGYDENRLFRLDPTSGRIKAQWRVDGGPRDVLFAAGSIWVANSTAPTVFRFSPVP